MNALFRPLLVAVCSLVALAPAFEASSQVLPQAIVQANSFDANARGTMANLVTPQMENLISGDPASVSEARQALVAPLNNDQASVAFRDTFSGMITEQMDRAVTHDSELVRINAMIILSRMTDAGSMAHISAGLEDDSPAVQRWAMRALGSRIAWWQLVGGMDNQIRGAIQQIAGKLGQQDNPPHTIVVGPALQILLNVDTAESRAALLEVLNDRVALHAADPNLSYAPERAVLRRYADRVMRATTVDRASSSGLARASYRYSVLILAQIEEGAINASNIDGAVSMLSQSVLSLGQVAAGARKQVPANQAAALNEWIPGRSWDNIQSLLTTEWVPILAGEPFVLNEEALAVE